MILRGLPPIGEIVLYTGPMFAQKSDHLIRDIRHRRRYGRQGVQLFHPAVNTRDGRTCKSRNGSEEPSQEFDSVDHLRTLIDPTTNAVAIDEVQFSDLSIVGLLIEARDRGQDVLCSGLDFDFRGVPFPVVSAIMNMADERHRLHAWCTQCGRRARWSQLLDTPPGDGNIVVGHNYEARCERCFMRQT